MTHLRTFFSVLLCISGRVIALFAGNHQNQTQLQISGGIPASIMQTAGGSVPKKIRSAWLSLNHGYEYIFYNDSMIEDFLPRYFPSKVLDLYKLLPENKYKADLFRYCYLFKHGGVYADIDLKPLMPVRSFLHKSSTFFSIWDGRGKHIFQAYIAVTPQHPLMSKAIEMMLKIGVSFYSQGPPHETHPTNQLYEIVKEALPDHSVHEGLHSTIYGDLQLGYEACPSGRNCVTIYRGVRIARSRYSDWNGKGFD